MVNIRGLWFTKNEIEANLMLYWGFIKKFVSSSIFRDNKWSNLNNTIFHHAYLIDMTLNKFKNHDLLLAIGDGFPRTHYFGHNSKIPQIGHFELTLDFGKMPNLLIISVWGHKNDPRTQTEALNLKWLIFLVHGLRKTRKKYFGTEMSSQSYYLSN